MVQIDIAMRTIDRGEINYIEKAIGSLAEDETFRDYKVRVFDSGSKDLGFLKFLGQYENVEVVIPEERISALENYARALLFTEEDWVLVLGDDFIFCNDIFQRIQRMMGEITEEKRIVSLFLTYEQGLGGAGTFFKLMPNLFWGGNILVRREDANSLAEYFLDKVRMGETKYMDILMKHWLMNNYPGHFFYMPRIGMCQHIGDNSTLGYNEERKGFVSDNFPDYV